MRTAGALRSWALGGGGSSRLVVALGRGYGGLGSRSWCKRVGDAGLCVAGTLGIMLTKHVCSCFPESCHGYVGHFSLGRAESAKHLVGGSLGQADGQDFESCRVLVGQQVHVSFFTFVLDKVGKGLGHLHCVEGPEVVHCNGSVEEFLEAGEGLVDVGFETGGHVVAVHELEGFAGQELVWGVQLAEQFLECLAVGWGLVGDIEVSRFDVASRSCGGGIGGRSDAGGCGDGGCSWCCCGGRLSGSSPGTRSCGVGAFMGCCRVGHLSGSNLRVVLSHGGSLFIWPLA